MENKEPIVTLRCETGHEWQTKVSPSAGMGQRTSEKDLGAYHTGYAVPNCSECGARGRLLQRNS